MNARLASALFVAGALMITTVGWSQNPIQDGIPLPNVPPQRGDLGLIWDMNRSGSFSRSISTSVENGVKKTRASENGLKAYIEEDPDNGITIKITKQYGPDDIETLLEEQPELYMHLKAMPTEVGDSEIEITVGVTTKYEAVDEDDLKERHPEAFEVFERFTKSDNGFSSFRGGFQFNRPQLIQPRELQQMQDEIRRLIDPNDIRIHEDKEGEDQDDENDSGDEDKKEKQQEKKDSGDKNGDKDT